MSRKLSAGFSAIESVITLTLISLLSLICFPLFKFSQELNSSLVTQGLIAKDGEKIVEIIERCIKNSSIINADYIGSDFVKNGSIVLEFNKTITPTLNEDFYRNVASKGNTLFIEYPRSNGKSIKSSFLIFQFFNSELRVIEYELWVKDASLVNLDTILENVSGSFEKNDYGIIIRMEVMDSLLKKKEEFLGYERFKK